MTILENHFEEKTTLILGNYISNGCQTFHVKDSEKVFNRYNVPQEMREEVLSYIRPDVELSHYADHDNPLVRSMVASQGFALDKLVYDRCWFVRKAVAEQGYGLDELYDDIDVDVRMAVARKRYKLEVLINDTEERVRKTVAEQGYGLDILCNDRSSLVRLTVAQRGYWVNLNKR